MTIPSNTDEEIRNTYPINTFSGTTQDELVGAIKQLIQSMCEEVKGEDEPEMTGDIENWKYYHNYHSNADDFINGYNQAKYEVSQALQTKLGGR